jgi:hypothetical protein
VIWIYRIVRSEAFSLPDIFGGSKKEKLNLFVLYYTRLTYSILRMMSKTTLRSLPPWSCRLKNIYFCLHYTLYGPLATIKSTEKRQKSYVFVSEIQWRLSLGGFLVLYIFYCHLLVLIFFYWQSINTECMFYIGRSNLNENSFLKHLFTIKWKSITHYFSI